MLRRWWSSRFASEVGANRQRFRFDPLFAAFALRVQITPNAAGQRSSLAEDAAKKRQVCCMRATFGSGAKGDSGQNMSEISVREIA